MTLKQRSSNKWFGVSGKFLNMTVSNWTAKWNLLLLTTRGRKWKMPCTMSAIKLYKFRTEFYIKIWSSWGCPRIWPCHCSRCQPLWLHIKEEGGSRMQALVLGFMWMPLKTLGKTTYRMYSCVTEELPRLTNAIFSSGPQRMGTPRRPWSSGLCLEDSWKIEICVSICSNLQSSALFLGQKKSL